MTTPTPTQTIRLRRGAQFWEADFSETAQADQVRELFGTCVLPTPWATTADGYDVAMRLSYKNPGVSIVVEQLTPPTTCRSCGELYPTGKGFDGECAACRGRDEATERRLLYGAQQYEGSCRYCGMPRPVGYSVTCGRSACQEAAYYDREVRTPRTRH